MDVIDLTKAILGLYKKASTDLPWDVESALARAYKGESGTAKQVLGDILKNTRTARAKAVPMCQDTGVPNFFVSAVGGYSRNDIRSAIIDATKIATEKLLLRPNAVDGITGKNSEDCTGWDIPSIHFQDEIVSSKMDEIGKACRISLLLKGGGSENVSAQYSLPDASLNAMRDLNGVRKAVLDAIQKAQGDGCPPGVVGVCIGGQRDSGYLEAKRQLLRRLDDISNNPAIAELERKIICEANSLGIGPAGLGGKTTVLAVKIGALHRHPASYFVSVAYNCWALRRWTLLFRDRKAKYM